MRNQRSFSLEFKRQVVEERIDQMVYELYGLTPEEIGVIEGKV